MFNEIRKYLISISDVKYKEFLLKLIPNEKRIIGVKIPVLKKLILSIPKQYYKDYLSINNNLYYEEIIIQGLIISKMELNLKELKKHIKYYLPKISNWAICDIFCSNIKIIKKYKDELFNFFISFLDETNEYQNRFVFVIFLNYYIDKKHINKIFLILKQNKCNKYYSIMAKAWLISQIYYKYKVETMKFLMDSNVDINLKILSFKKIIESNYITNSEKEKIKIILKELRNNLLFL